MERAAMAVGLLGSLALAGCIGGTAPAVLAPAPTSPPPCVDPWPCGSPWPAGLAGPFGLDRLEHLPLPAANLTLDGWVYQPKVPSGVRVPIVLQATPYLGQCTFHNAPSSFACRSSPDHESPGTGNYSEDWDFQPFYDAGYAVAVYSIPGTGASGGCFDDYGPVTQAAMHDLVEALAAQPWSNGRVAMWGLSAMGTTPFAAAITNPPALKTIVAAGIQTNLYTFSATPNGALDPTGFFPLRYGLSVGLPPLGGRPAAIPEGLGAARFCDDALTYMTNPQAQGLTNDRNGAFWEARDLLARFPNVTAAVFVAHGLDDAFGSGHAFQEDDVWAPLAKAPKRMLLGQWEHQFPPDEALADATFGTTWWAVLQAWLDFWLKGQGAAPRLGTVDYQDSTGAWRASSAWPPAEARGEALFLSAAGASPAPGQGDVAFNLLPHPAPLSALLCPASLAGLTVPGAPAMWAGFLTPPLATRAVLAGNPFAVLNLTADAPAAVIEARLYDVGPDLACGPDGLAGGARWLTRGAVDLRFDHANFVAEEASAGTARPVRIDFWNIADVLEPGHRLALLLKQGYSDPHPTPITLHATGGPPSQLVLPLVDGTVGGEPQGPFPHKPFALAP